MYTDDIINVPTDDPPDFDNVRMLDGTQPSEHDGQTVEQGALPTDQGGEPTGPIDLLTDDDGSPPSSSRAAIAAVVATLVLLATMGIVLVRGSNSTAAGAPVATQNSSAVPETTAREGAVAPVTVPPVSSSPVITVPPVISTPPAVPTPPTIPPAVPTPPPVPVPPAVPTPPPVPTPPAEPVPPAITVPPVDTAPPVVPPPVEPPAAPPVETVPPVVPPAPAGELAAQSEYLLDPGVDAVSIVLSNQGDLDLTYEIVNDGEGFSADQPTATIAAGASTNVWIELDVTAADPGPTLFEQVVNVESDAGDATVTISGQVEKPGFVIADFDSVPFVDLRATLRFTNVGGLPVQIVGLDAPGLTTAPIPDEIAAGETYELEVAICEGGAPIPTIVPLPQPIPQPPKFIIGGWVELETQTAPDAEPTVARIDLQAMVLSFDPPDCTPIVAAPVGDITFDLG